MAVSSWQSRARAAIAAVLQAHPDPVPPRTLAEWNPSITDATTDDQTIRKEIGFARRWGLHFYVKVNASSIVATDPKYMKRARKDKRDNLAENDAWILAAIALARDFDGRFLASWGGHIDPARQVEIARMLSDAGVSACCLGTNGDGTPKHPLYLKGSTHPVEWRCP